MSIGDDIKQRREFLNLTVQEVADYVGVSKATVSRWESGTIKNMRRDKIAKLSEILKVRPNFIMGLEEDNKPLAIAEDVKINGTNFKYLSQGLIEVPLYGKASAGNGYLNLSEEVGYYPIPKEYYNKNVFAVLVSGVSMEGPIDSIPDGSIALVSPDLCSDPMSLNGKICVFEYDDETYIKQLNINKQGIIILKSFNPEYDEIIVNNPEVLFCKGRVIRTFTESKW